MIPIMVKGLTKVRDKNENCVEGLTESVKDPDQKIDAGDITQK